MTTSRHRALDSLTTKKDCIVKVLTIRGEV